MSGSPHRLWFQRHEKNPVFRDLAKEEMPRAQFGAPVEVGDGHVFYMRSYLGWRRVRVTGPGWRDGAADVGPWAPTREEATLS